MTAKGSLLARALASAAEDVLERSDSAQRTTSPESVATASG
jgi:hypothetical protein